MTDFERVDLFAALTELSRRYPHWRIGQLVANVAGWADTDIWDAEDANLLAAVQNHLANSSETPPRRERTSTAS